MNVSVATTKREEAPQCFGSHLWDKNAPECAGGPDAGYVNPDNQKNWRYRCNFFEACGARSAISGRLIPPQQLVRPAVAPSPPTFTHAPSPPLSGFAEFIKRVDDSRAAGRPIAPPTAQAYAQPAPQQATSWVLNYGMPSYLSTPEAQHPGESIWSVLLREVIRALFKAGGHTIAHFFDTRPLRKG
jgi:hypothetical protein